MWLFADYHKFEQPEKFLHVETKMFVLARKGCYLVGLRPAAQRLCCLMYEQPNGKQKQKFRLKKNPSEKKKRKKRKPAGK